MIAMQGTILQPDQAGFLFKQRLARRVPDCKNLDFFRGHAVEQPKRKINECDDAYSGTLANLWRATWKLQ